MWISVGIALSYAEWTSPQKAFNRRKTLLLCRTWKRYDIYIRMRWTNNHGHYCNILLYITFRFGFVHLQHSNVSKLNTVCALHYEVYCAYNLILLYFRREYLTAHQHDTKTDKMLTLWNIEVQTTSNTFMSNITSIRWNTERSLYTSNGLFHIPLRYTLYR